MLCLISTTCNIICSRVTHYTIIAKHKQIGLGFRVYDAHTNLPARGPASTNLPARSPALRTYPPVVQHT
ncbi:hypothetical protein DEO72_LG4g351 [Vigna unguiculata]|uniref:Uncharacterized protein n=1 Tax=Vigna unguiculata TaxID=3917 RepID=A0A4D6LLE1_VIGUN|nr:hypothetical protein DEO72_LG4g351 [Vigna unguiculata]